MYDCVWSAGEGQVCEQPQKVGPPQLSMFIVCLLACFSTSDNVLCRRERRDVCLADFPWLWLVVQATSQLCGARFAVLGALREKHSTGLDNWCFSEIVIYQKMSNEQIPEIPV